MKNITLNLSHEAACAMQDAILAGLPYLQSKIIRERIKPGVEALDNALRGNFVEAREKAKTEAKKKPVAKKKAQPKKEKSTKKPVAKKAAPVQKKKTTKKVVERKPPVLKEAKKTENKKPEVKGILPDTVPMPVIPEVASPSNPEESKAA